MRRNLFLAVVLAPFAAGAQQAMVDSEIYADLESSDRSRVIIVMREPEPGDVRGSVAFSSPETYLSDLPASADGVDNIGAIEGAPAAVAELDRAALERLRTDPAIELIAMDVADPPSLLDTISLIGATDVWQHGLDGSGHAIVVLDTGVDSDHRFLANKIVKQACFSVRDPQRNVDDLCDRGELRPGNLVRDTSPRSAGHCPTDTRGCSHGTHVAGIAAGEEIQEDTVSERTISGIARGADIIAIQVFSKFNNPEDCRSGDGTFPCAKSFRSAQLAALIEVKDLIASGEFNVAAVNMSLGAGRENRPCDAVSPLASEIRALRDLGVATFVAAGNTGFRNAVGHPACISTAITVGAADKDGNMADFSNRREGLVDLITVGVDVRSSVPGGDFAPDSGTSMATPAAAGAFTDLKSGFPEATIDDIEFAMKRTGDAVEDPASGVLYPAVNLRKAHSFLAATLVAAAADEGEIPAGSAMPEALMEGRAPRFIIETPGGATEEVATSIERAAEALGGGQVTATPLGDQYIILESSEPVSQKALREALEEAAQGAASVFIDQADEPME